MIKDVYPLPRIDELLDAIGSARFFSKFDVRHGFHHRLVRNEDRPKTAFVLFEGTWQWVRCPMGICNAPATFQRAMNMAFRKFVLKTRLTQSIINYCVIVYMDDIMVYSSSYEGHLQYIEWTLHALRDVGFKVALEKCQFFLTTISFLGHVVTDHGLRPEPQKVAAVRDAPVPTTITQVRAFLGLVSYYQRFIKGFAAIVEGDLLGFLFGSVRPGHRQLIVQELVVPLAQLVDDLSLDIVSQGDESLAPHVLTRTLAPYLQWTACLEEPGSESALPSRQEYLKPSGIINLAFYPKQDTSEKAVEEEEEEATEEKGDVEEETSEEGSYSEHSEGEQSEEEEEEEEEEDEEEEAGSEWEALPEEEARTGTEAEDPEAASKREEIAAGKNQLEFASEANLRINDDPTWDPEPPKPEDGDPATAAPSASRRRRSRSPSSSMYRCGGSAFVPGHYLAVPLTTSPSVRSLPPSPSLANPSLPIPSTTSTPPASPSPSIPILPFNVQPPRSVCMSFCLVRRGSRATQ
ncbi:hypothetical protein CBR_g32301 [Chara braunii]|uniref:Reverse transcriptase domain-containing protein n=1 Tax=Chara braunii TaxID=69332 RepID=A0A388JND4_CHABU|nr:hypothetical protein CBR_g32301 [Chara braunii]|eukprot:GBG59288.1 hypothetical protein CBR_g32301 [Chara braunii]